MRIALVHSGVAGTEHAYRGDVTHHYRLEHISANWQPCFDHDDVVLVPNGANHVALYEARAHLHKFLARGGALLCFCGFFTPWLPGYYWQHSIGHDLRKLRYRVVNDELNLFEGVDVEKICRDEHGIRGGWACGDIQTNYAASVVLVDNYERTLVVADRRSTAGLIIATASGPLSDDAPHNPADGTRRLYRNILRACRAHGEAQHD